MALTDNTNKAMMASDFNPHSPEHRDKFIKEIGKHLCEVAPETGSIQFHFNNGCFVNANYLVSIR